jgi:mannan endo-1,4-beta-mannosidase
MIAPVSTKVLGQQNSCSMIHGVIHGDFLQDYSTWIGKKPAVLTLFTDTTPSHAKFLFDFLLDSVWDFGSVPMISLQLHTSKNTPKNIMELISKGEMDQYFTVWANRLGVFLAGPDKQYNTDDDRKVFIRFGHEMNGSWYPWSGDPENYKKAWKRVFNIFSEVGVNDLSHTQWIFSVNNRDSRGEKFENYYPGDSYVDWTGLDGYNKGDKGFQQPEVVFGDAISRLKKLAPGKPVSVNEIGAASQKNIERKNLWIRNAFRYFDTECVRMVNWFNIDSDLDQGAFGVNGDVEYTGKKRTYRAYSEYKNALLKRNVIHSSGAGRLSDKLFKGQ